MLPPEDQDSGVPSEGLDVQILDMAAFHKYWFLALVIQHNKYISRGTLQVLLEGSVIVRILDDTRQYVAFLCDLLDDIIILQLGQLVVKKYGSVYECWSQLSS